MRDASLAPSAHEHELVDEIDDGAFVAIQEADKLAEIRRSNVVVDGVEIAVIGHVERVDAEADVVDLAATVSKERHAELAVKLHIQRKIFREALPVRRAHILLLNVTNHGNFNAVYNNVTAPNFGQFVGFLDRRDGAVIDFVD